MIFFRNRFSLPFCVGCLTIFLSCLVFYSFGSQKPVFLAGMDNKITDIMFRIRGPRPHSGRVVIVDIDEKSLSRLGQWPWPRNLMADLTRAIHEKGAQVIGFDIVFAEADRSSPKNQLEVLTPLLGDPVPVQVRDKILDIYNFDHDAVFGEALANARAVLGYAFQLRDDGLKIDTQVPFPSARLLLIPETARFDTLALVPAYRAIVNVDAVAMAQSEGFFNVFTDDSGTVRQVPLLMSMDGIPYPSLALEAFRIGEGFEDISIHTDKRIKTLQTPVIGVSLGDRFYPTSNNGRLFINHRGPSNTFSYVSAGDLLLKRVFPDFKGKFILVGSSATGLFDLRATPFSPAMPGIEINANIIDNLIQNDPFAYDIFTEIAISYILMVFGGLLLTLLLCRLTPLAGALSAFLFFQLCFPAIMSYFS